MVYTSQNAAFRRDKQQFFSQYTTNTKPDFNSVDKRVENIGHTYLLHNQNALETEFNQMFNILQKQDDENKAVFWVYCYYLAKQLEAFHKAYGQDGKAKMYSGLEQKIKDRLNHDVKHDETEESFIQYLYGSFKESFNNLISSPWHLSRIRDYVAFTNLCRIYWVFCRLTLTSGLPLAKAYELIDKLDAILGTNTDVDKIIAAMGAPTFIINYFSVGFFLARLIIDTGSLLKHTFFPSKEEKGAENSCDLTILDDLPGAASLEAYRNSYILVQDDNDSDVELYYIPKSGVAQRLSIKDNKKLKEDLIFKLHNEQSIKLTFQEIKELITSQTEHVPEATTAYERFLYEFYKRHCNFANDILWAFVNYLSNFNKVSDPTAGVLTAIFLGFDVSMALYKCSLAKEEYLTKKSQYLLEIEEYNNPERFKKLTDKQRLAHIEMLHKQLTALEIDWRTKEATFHFVAAAAAILMTGFSASMLVNPGVVVVGCYVASLVAVSMYLSAGSYSKFTEKSLHLEQAQLTGQNLPVSVKEYQLARNEFIYTMTKNALIPPLLISAYAICWPAAIGLTAMYLGFELCHSSYQHSGSKAVNKMAANDSAKETVDDNHLLPSPC